MRPLAALTVIVGVLLLTSATSAQVIDGCVKTKNGAPRIVADPADCTSRETPISWNQVGPQGEPGTVTLARDLKPPESSEKLSD
jgi:hypothetical protein